MVADLVDQYVRHEMLEAVVAVGPFIQDRAAEQPHAVGQRARLVDAALGQRDAFVNSRELDRVVEPDRAQRLVVGEVLDQQDDVPQALGKRPRQGVERPARDCLDLLGGRTGVEAAHRWRA